MGDLSYVNRTDEVKIAGQDASGNNVNYVSADINGNMSTRLSPGLTKLTTAAVNISSSGDNNLVAAVAGKVVRVYKIFLVVSSVVNFTFKDGAIALSGALPMLANGSFVLDFDSEPWFTTSIGNAFILNLSSGVQVSGTVYYTQV